MRRKETEIAAITKINVKGKGGKGKPKKRWLDIIESYTRVVGVFVENVEDRDKWR